jgi:hypothetical protein
MEASGGEELHGQQPLPQSTVTPQQNQDNQAASRQDQQHALIPLGRILYCWEFHGRAGLHPHSTLSQLLRPRREKGREGDREGGRGRPSLSLRASQLLESIYCPSSLPPSLPPSLPQPCGPRGRVEKGGGKGGKEGRKGGREDGKKRRGGRVHRNQAPWNIQALPPATRHRLKRLHPILFDLLGRYQGKWEGGREGGGEGGKEGGREGGRTSGKDARHGSSESLYFFVSLCRPGFGPPPLPPSLPPCFPLF